MLRRCVWRLCRCPDLQELRARHSFQAEVRHFAHRHGMIVTPLSDSELHISVPSDGELDAAPLVIAKRTGTGTVSLKEPHQDCDRPIARGLLEAELRCLAHARTAAGTAHGFHSGDVFALLAVAVHRVLVSVEEHAGQLLVDPRGHLTELFKNQDECLVAACIVAATQQDAAQKRDFSDTLGAVAERQVFESSVESAVASRLVSALRHGDHERHFCHSVIASVDLAACGFTKPDAVRARLDEYDGLWKFLPAPTVELPTAAWWAQWCDGDMQQCRPMGRSMPAHAVLASLLQLSSATNPRTRLFAERVSALFALRETDIPRPGGSVTVVQELFVGAGEEVSQSEADKLACDGSDVDHLASVVRSVAIEAVQQAGGRYRHLGIACPRRVPGAVDFETIKEGFLKRAAVAYARHGVLDMGVAAPSESEVKVPGLASIVRRRVCGQVPLTFRRSDFDVACSAADEWLMHWDPQHSACVMPGSGAHPSVCVTFASMGRGKTVQLLLSLGLLVEAYGGAALYATGGNDQGHDVHKIIRTHEPVRCVSQSPELAMALAVLHRTCLAQVSTEQANTIACTATTPFETEAAFKKVMETHDLHDPVKDCVSALLCNKMFLKQNLRLATALAVAREMLGCHDKSVPLFLAVDEVAQFAFEFRSATEEVKNTDVAPRPVAENAIKTIITESTCRGLCGTVLPIMGALDSFDFEKLATRGAGRSVLLMPLSPVIPMDQKQAELMPPIARAITCQRAEFKNPSEEVRAALSRVGALLMSPGGHGRVLSQVLHHLAAVTKEHVLELMKDVKATSKAGKNARYKKSRPAQRGLEAQERAIAAVMDACDKGERNARDPKGCERYDCSGLRHPCLTTHSGDVLESRDRAQCVLEHLTSWFRLPPLREKDLDADQKAILRTRMDGAWEFAGAVEEQNAFKVHPPPVALPAVLSRFLVGATSIEHSPPAVVDHRLTALFGFVVEMNSAVAAFAADPPHNDDERARSKLFEMAASRTIAMLLMLPVGINREPWLTDHMQLCHETSDCLHGAVCSIKTKYSLAELRTLSTFKGNR